MGEMKSRRHFLTASIALGGASLLDWGPLRADAQTARSGGAPNTQLLQQMQQMASERTSLQAENQKMKKELDDLRKERDQLKKKGQDSANERLRAGEAALARANEQRQSTEQELTQTKAKMTELIAKFRETLATMRDVETESATTKQSLTTRDQELHVCVDRNLALYKLNDEILTHFDHQGGWSRVAQAEPFTKIKRVQLENLIDEYKGRADDQRAAPVTAVPGTAASNTDLKEKR
jgi:chromosome segregation ATPase